MGISCKCVIFKESFPQNVGTYPNSTFNFVLPSKKLSLSSNKNNIKFRKFNFDIISIKYLKAPSRKINKLNKED